MGINGMIFDGDGSPVNNTPSEHTQLSSEFETIKEFDSLENYYTFCPRCGQGIFTAIGDVMNSKRKDRYCANCGEFVGRW